MSELNETRATETTQPNTQPQSATSTTLVLTVAEAAEALGITPQAVRKQIKTGRLPARRSGRSWQVILTRATGETDATETTQPHTQPVSQPSGTQANHFAALIAPIVAPWAERVEALSREAERERLRAEVAERERDTLRAELAAMQTTAYRAPDPPSEGDATLGQAWWRRWWRSLTEEA